MKYKKALIILCVIVFFLTALTFYLNRVIFPGLIKQIVIERVEEKLKRKVELGSIHFNWVKGFIVDKIKIYENDSTDTVFAQADRVTFGILFFPGFKHNRIDIPFINVRSPSVRLIRTGKDTWNFSDMINPSAPPSTSPPATPNPTESKTIPLEIAWGGITISDGKCQVDDFSHQQAWREFFDNISLKLSLSYKGISYDFSADIPGKKGYIGAAVYYQPITKNTQAQIHLLNIDTASYLSLINIPDMHLKSGIIKEILLDIDYTHDKTSVQGDVLMKDLDIASQDQNFKGDIQIHDLDAQYLNGDIMDTQNQTGDITARGQIFLSNIQTKVPGLAAGGNVQANVNEFDLTREGLTFKGSLHAQNIFVRLKDRQVQVDTATMENIKITKNIDGIQSVGSVKTKGLFVQWPDQKLQGDIDLTAVTMRMKDENDITLRGELQADHFSTSIKDRKISSQHVLLEDARVSVIDQKNITVNTQLSLTDMLLVLGRNVKVSAASIKADRFSFNDNDGIIKVDTLMNGTEGILVLGKDKTIDADPQLELNLQLPLSDPSQVVYKGSITLSDALIRGFAPFQTLEGVGLDADFQNDQATINALSATILDTSVHINGTVKNFKKPYLDILAEADELNLSHLKDLAPQFIDQLGLSFDGTANVKVQYQGVMERPQTAKIFTVASVTHVSASSRKFHQRIKNITGVVEMTPQSFKWHDFTATYQGKQYASTGSIKNFRKPKILLTLDGPNLELKADMFKNNDLITINALTGKFLNADFDSKGSIILSPDQGPIFDINSNMSFLLEDLDKELPLSQRNNIYPLHPTGMMYVSTDLKGTGLDWKKFEINTRITSDRINIFGYTMNGLKITGEESAGKFKNLILDGKLYDGSVHAVGSLDMTSKGLPYDVALNIDSTDLHKLKMDSPLKMEEINGKFFLTAMTHGTLDDFKNKLHATGSLAVRDGFLGSFDLFKGMLSVFNDTLHLGQIEITEAEGNFTVDDHKVNTVDFKLKGPTIALLSRGWVDFDETCDLDVTVDLSTGTTVPDIAHDALSTLDIHLYDKITNPKFKKKISVPSVINSLFKNLLQ